MQQPTPPTRRPLPPSKEPDVDHALTFVIAGGALIIAVTTIAGAIESRRNRRLEHDMDAYARVSLAELLGSPEPAPAYLTDPHTTRLDTAIHRMHAAREHSPSEFLRDLTARKIDEAHATLLTRIAADQRAGRGGIRARARHA